MALKEVLRFFVFAVSLCATTLGVQTAFGQQADVAKLVHPEVAERLSLDDAQRASLQKLLQERAEAIAKATDEAAKTKVAGESEAKILSVLTDEQRTKFLASPSQTKLMFQFREMKWDDVLNWFASQQDLTLVMDRVPPGTFTYSDSRTYSPSEGIDLLNSVLLTRNFALVRREKMLVVMELSDSIPIELLPQVTLEQLPERGRFELVSVMFPLAGRPMEAVLQEVKPYLSAYGRAVPLAQGGRLLVIETAGKMQTINEMIAAVPLPKKPPAPEKPEPPPQPVFASYSLGQLDPTQTLETIKKLIASEQITVNSKTAVLSAYVVPAHQQAIKAALDQMLMNIAGLPASESAAYQFTGILPADLVKQVSAIAPKALVTATTDRLLVIASREDQEIVRNSLASINILPVDTEKAMQVFDVEPTSAVLIEAALKSFLPQSQIAANAKGGLIVRGPAKDLKVAAEIIEVWQRFKSPNQLQLKSFELERLADATWLATVQKIVPSASTWLSDEGRKLMLLGNATEVNAVEAMLPQLVTLLPEQIERRLKIYTLTKNQLLRRASLADLPKSLTTIKQVDGSSKSEILVWASTKQHEEFAKLLEGLDAPPPALPATLPRSYPLAVQESTVVVQLLAVEFPDAKITASVDGKQLTVLADESLHAKIAERIELFNTQLTKRPELILQSYSVRGFTAVALQTALTPLLTTARVNLDIEHNRVLVTADANTHAEIAKLVQALSEEAGVDQQKVVIAYPVSHASPTQLKTVLDQLVTGSTIIADEKLRQLVVTGTLAQQATIRTTLEQVDRSATAKGPVNIQSFETKKLQAIVLLPALQKLWPTMELTADASANRILASGTEAELAQLGSAIDRLISAPDGKQQVVKTYPVPAGEMTTLATILGQIAPQAIVSSDPISRTVTVWASDEQQLRVQQALEQISRTAADAKVPATYNVKPTQVIAVQTSLQTLFPTVGVSSIPLTGQLIVVAAPETQKRIAEVIELLATGPNAAENTVQVFRVDPERVQFSAMLSALQATLPSQIRIEPNAANSTLLAIGTPSELEIVASKVKLLEQQLPQPDQRSSVVYPLQHGNTLSAITILQTLVPKATLAQDAVNKTIAATATVYEQQQIAEFLKAFDVPKKTNLETRVYRFKKGSARGVQVVLNELMPEASIYGSREERVLIATATAENHERISSIVRDFESGFAETETRVFPIGKGNATSLRQAIQEMSPEIKVAADATSNSLIVTASREELERITKIVEEVELGGDKARETRFLAVLHADPLPLAKALKESFPKAEFSADSISGGIFATASSEDHAAIGKVLESLNKQPTKLPTLRAFVLKNAAPEVVAAAMESAFGRRGSVGISFSRETKSVFVVGSNQELEIASQLIEQLDVDQTQSSSRTMRAFALNGADGKSVAESIENLFKDSAAKVEVSHDLLNEQLYVTGSAAQLRSVEESLKQFTPPKRELEIIQLDSTDPYSFKIAAEALFDDEPTNTAPQITVDSNLQQVLIRATPEQLESIRKLLKQMGESTSLANSSVNYDRIRFVPVHRNSQRLLDELQRVWPSMRNNPLQIIQPAGIAPIQSQEQKTAPENQPPREKQPENRQSQKPVGQVSSLGTVRLASLSTQDASVSPAQNETQDSSPSIPKAPDQKSPVIIVTGEEQWTLASDDTQALDQLSRLLDAMLSPAVTPFATTGNFSVYLLRHAGADQVQELLTELFKPADRSGRGSGIDLFQRVKIVADPRINGLIVTGNRADRRIVEELLGVIDSEDLLDTLQQITPTTVQLQSANAKNVADIIEDVYKSQLSAGAGRRPVEIPEGVTTSVAIVLQQLNAQASSPLLTIAVDEITNSLILRAPVDLTNEIKAFIEKLDKQSTDAPGRRVQLLRLESTNAKNLEKALKILTTR